MLPNYETDQDNIYEDINTHQKNQNQNQTFPIKQKTAEISETKVNLTSDNMICEDIKTSHEDEATLEITRNPNFIIYETPKSLKTHANGDIYYTEKDGVKQVVFDDETYAVMEKK